MCKAINDMIECKEKESAINFYRNGVSIEIIAKSLSLPIEKNSFMDFICRFTDFVMMIVTIFAKGFSNGRLFFVCTAKRNLFHFS